MIPEIPIESAQYEILALQNTHTINLKQYNKYNLVNRILKNLIIGEINNIHINKLENKYIIYQNITML